MYFHIIGDIVHLARVGEIFIQLQEKIMIVHFQEIGITEIVQDIVNAVDVLELMEIYIPILMDKHIVIETMNVLVLITI